MTIFAAVPHKRLRRRAEGIVDDKEVSMFEAMASFMLVEHANGALFNSALGSASIRIR